MNESAFFKFPGFTLIFSIGGEFERWSILSSESNSYRRWAFAWFRIHIVKANLDAFLGMVGDEIEALSKADSEKVPARAIRAMKNPGFGLSVLIAFGDKKMQGTAFELSPLGILRIAIRRFYLHLGLVDMDLFWAGVYETAIWLKQRSILDHLTDLFGLEENCNV